MGLLGQRFKEVDNISSPYDHEGVDRVEARGFNVRRRSRLAAERRRHQEPRESSNGWHP
jgi:hypothetical protein